MHFETIELEHTPSISWITLNRPEAANSFSHQLLTELSAALTLLETEGAKIVGIRGAGRGFSAGYDLNDVAYAHTQVANPVADRARLARYMAVYLQVWDHPKPVIAAVHGYCIGGATQICAYSDMVIVDEEASVGESNIPIGGGFVAPTWVPHVGVRRAKELSFTPGHRIDGRTAAEWGWANYAVPADEVIPTAEAWAEKFSRMPADALRMKKMAANRSAESGSPRAIADLVPEFNALTHAAPAVAVLRSWLAEVGIKEATRAFSTGEGLPEGI